MNIMTVLRAAAAMGVMAAVPAGAQDAKVFFSTFNGGGVANRPTVPAVVTFSQPMRVKSIMTYHWNGGRGSPGGTLSLRGANGRVFGPWTVAASGGSGAQNVNWTVRPDIVLPAGNYTVLDSDQATWSQNEGSSGRGFVEIRAVPDSLPSDIGVEQQVPTVTAAPAPAPALGNHKLVHEVIPNLWGHAKADLTWYAGAYSAGDAWLGAAGAGQYKIVHGTAKFYSAGGALEMTVEYRDGLREGESRSYWDNSKLQSTGTYHLDKIVDGTWKVWNRDGQPSTSQETGVLP
jgi:hypothetical protein